MEKGRENARLEELFLSEEKTGDKEGELGRELAKRAQSRSGARPSKEVVDLGPSSLGLEVGLKGKKEEGWAIHSRVSSGPKFKTKRSDG